MVIGIAMDVNYLLMIVNFMNVPKMVGLVHLNQVIVGMVAKIFHKMNVLTPQIALGSGKIIVQLLRMVIV